MTMPGKRLRGSPTGFSVSLATLKVKFCRKLAKNKNSLFLARTSPGQTLLPAPKESNLELKNNIFDK